MLKSIIGTKIGMTQIFDQVGNIIPVTVISCKPCMITNLCTKDRNGYNAVQLGYGDVKEKILSKSIKGCFQKNNIPYKKYLKEFKLNNVSNYQIGQEIKVDIFKSGDFVDVTGITKGKGYAGVVKRHGFGGGPTTHGQSDRQRAPGSSGGQGPQRVLRGTRRAGHLGHEYVTIQRLKIILVDPDKNIMLIKGAIPGVNKGVLLISHTVKRIKVAVISTAKKKVASVKAKK